MSGYVDTFDVEDNYFNIIANYMLIRSIDAKPQHVGINMNFYTGCCIHSIIKSTIILSACLRNPLTGQ
jgi:hypothetical protein